MLHLVTYHLHKNGQELLPYIQKAAEDTSTMGRILGDICLSGLGFLVVSFSGHLLMESFFRVLRQTSLLYSKHCFHGMFHKRSDRLLAVPVFGCIDDIICLNQNLVVDAVDLLRSMVVPHQISHPVHRIYSICRSFILPVILEASLCATDPVRGSRALRHNFC